MKHKAIFARIRRNTHFISVDLLMNRSRVKLPAVLVLGLLFLVPVLVIQHGEKQAPTVEHSSMHQAASETALATCGSSHGSHGKEGKLIALFNEAGTFVRWQCSMNSHMNCFSENQEGLWDFCDYPPTAMPWPDPIPLRALEHPELYVQHSPPPDELFSIR